MNVRDLAFVGLRLLGIWFLVEGLHALMFMLQWIPYRSELDWANAIGFTASALVFSIGVLLWRRARSWSARVARGTKAEVADVDVPEAFQRAAYSVLGVWFVVTSGANLVGAGVGAWGRSDASRDAWQIVGGYGATLVAAGLLVVFGLALVLRGDVIADGWRRLQRLPPPAGGTDEERASLEPGPHAWQSLAFSCVGLILFGNGASDAIAGAIRGLGRWSDLWEYLSNPRGDAFGLFNEAAFDFVPGVAVALGGALVFLRSARLSAWLQRRQARALSAFGER